MEKFHVRSRLIAFILLYGLMIPLADQWALRLDGDIGGFGVSSDFTRQGLEMIDFQPWRNVAIVAGYRAIGTDYETGSGNDRFTYDATVQGPLGGSDSRW